MCVYVHIKLNRPRHFLVQKAMMSKILSLRLGIGCVFVLIGLILTLLVPWFVKSIMTTVRTLGPDSVLFEIWRDNPVPVYFNLYMFNWTNPEDIYDLHVKPRFQEVGPFVFRSTTEKINIIWNDNSTVTYGSVKRWYFEEEKSVGPLSTEIFTVDAVAITAAYQLRFQNYFIKRGFDISLRSFSRKLYLVKPVGEILFDGYQDTLVDIANKLPLPENIKKPSHDKFGWFYARNGSTTHEGTFNAGTAEENLGKLYEWNYANESSYFTGGCNQIKGSAGEYYPIPMQKNHLTLFWAEACRPLTMDFVEEVTVDGTLGYKYTVGDSFLDNGTKLCENSCYANGGDIPYGLLNLSTCKYGAPGFLSLPYFYKVHPFYVDKIEGLKPNKTRHEMFAIHEPTTGIPLHVEGRFQLNMLLSPIEYISIFEGVPLIYMPVLWIETIGKIPWSYHIGLKLFLRLSIILYSLAGAAAVIGALLIWFSLKNRNQFLRSNFDMVRTETDTNNIEQIKLSLLNQQDSHIESKT